MYDKSAEACYRSVSLVKTVALHSEAVGPFDWHQAYLLNVVLFMRILHAWSMLSITKPIPFMVALWIIKHTWSQQNQNRPNSALCTVCSLFFNLHYLLVFRLLQFIIFGGRVLSKLGYRTPVLWMMFSCLTLISKDNSNSNLTMPHNVINLRVMRVKVCCNTHYTWFRHHLLLVCNCESLCLSNDRGQHNFVL